MGPDLDFDSMENREKWDMLVTVANMYYNANLTQQEIAERIYTSRSKISRLLTEARKCGIVEVYIHGPWNRNIEYESRIMKVYPNVQTQVISFSEKDDAQGMQKLTETAAYYFNSVIKKNAVIGISRGRTLYQFVHHISLNSRKNLPITVLPIMGGSASDQMEERDALDLAKELATAYGGKCRYLYAPLFVTSAEIRENLVKDENIRNVLELSKNADMILTSVGSVTHNAGTDFLKPEDLEQLKNLGAVGTVGGHFFDINGQEIRTEKTACHVGIELEDICSCPNVICIAYGKEKSEALKGALNGGLVDTVIMDEKCAAGLLELL